MEIHELCVCRDGASREPARAVFEDHADRFAAGSARGIHFFDRERRSALVIHPPRRAVTAQNRDRADCNIILGCGNSAGR